ncbi:CDC45-like protein [Geopyxis carbonaria]|nr:CDC45-like protein [Geopyxis carbonaria]
MYISRSQFAAAYTHLKENVYSATNSVLILCALDTDSLCAARILTFLMKRDHIPHQLKPVAGYKELERINQTIVKDDAELRFVICLGLGGLVEISEHLSLKRPGGDHDVECWVVDGRRPWNLYNVYSNGPEGVDPAETGGKVTGGKHGVGKGLGGVKCFDDGDIEEEMSPERDAFKALMEMPEADSDDSDSDEDDEDDDEDEANEERASEDGDADGGVKLLQPGNNRKRKSSEDLEDETDDDVASNRSRRPRRDGKSSSGTSTPILHKHTLLSTASARPIASSPPPLNAVSGLSSPSQSQILPAAVPPPQLSAKVLRKKLRRLRRTNERVLGKYYMQGTWYGEPISNIMYSMASDLAREDNDLLWLSIVGVCSGELYGRKIGPGAPRQGGGGYGAETRERQIHGLLEDEVRRLNPPELNAPNSGSVNGTAFTSLQTTARSPSDTAIRLSPEYQFMLIRHWSLYDSMLHSAYLGTKLHIWSETGKKRLHKLLAKMGFSLAQCKQNYTHMDMDLKRSLKEKLEALAPYYHIEDVVKQGFVRCWGWRGCLSAADVGYVIGGILEVGAKAPRRSGYTTSEPPAELTEVQGRAAAEKESEEWVRNFWDAYDALDKIEALKAALPTAMDLHRAILRTGTTLIEKRLIKPLRAFRLAVVKEGPDLAIFTHPNALSKLGLWISEAVIAQETERSKRHLPLVIACLNERRGVYVVVGTALGAQAANTARATERRKKREEREERRRRRELEGEDGEEGESDEESDSDGEGEEEEVDVSKSARNRFGIAFQEVAAETQARIRIDSFEATAIEVRKEDLSGFLEGLSMKSVMG